MTRLAEARPQKYGAKRCSECMVPAHTGCRNCGQHQSIREHHRYQELVLLERAGEIRNLRCQQPVLELVSRQKLWGRWRPARTYTPDFSYEERHADGWRYVIEDCKGYRTPMFTMKAQQVMEKHGLEVQLS